MVEERADFTSSVRVLAFETFQKDSIHSTGEDEAMVAVAEGGQAGALQGSGGHVLLVTPVGALA